MRLTRAAARLQVTRDVAGMAGTNSGGGSTGSTRVVRRTMRFRDQKRGEEFGREREHGLLSDREPAGRAWLEAPRALAVVRHGWRRVAGWGGHQGTQRVAVWA